MRNFGLVRGSTALLVVLAGCEGGSSNGTPGGGGTTGAAGSSGTAGSGGRGGAIGSAGTTGGTGSAGSRTNPLAQDVIDAFVAAHNQARAGSLNPPPAPALPPVTWDDALADAAYNYTTRCQGAGGLLSHNARRSEDYQALGGSGYVGENIYGTTAASVQPSAVVASWMSEAPLYNYATNNIGDAGHYTQVVWRASVRIGCAIFNCPSLTYHTSVLCDYAPGGNISNQKPY